jgi:hypothetical protein
MDSLPPALLDFISIFRPLLQAEVFDSFTYLLCGLLICEAKHGTVRAFPSACPNAAAPRFLLKKYNPNASTPFALIVT